MMPSGLASSISSLDGPHYLICIYVDSICNVCLQMTQNEARGGVLRLVVAGGRAQEKPGASGAVAVGVRTLSEGGAVGGFSREQVDFLCHSVRNLQPAHVLYTPFC